MTGLSAHTLRYYEKMGLLGGVGRNHQGYRQYDDADLAWIEFLLRLRATGMPIRDMRRFSELRSRGESTLGERREILETHQRKIKTQIQELERHLAKIQEKVALYADVT
ncbi:MerR family transcriptional regulator [Paenibacillus sp. GCM10023250]|uniref:MerR family transcriptional regulator n=1 Tax=Paenibacillus sp. GCM10023250 TaxID=3252648 RepID=UPI0036162B32